MAVVVQAGSKDETAGVGYRVMRGGKPLKLLQFCIRHVNIKNKVDSDVIL